MKNVRMSLICVLLAVALGDNTNATAEELDPTTPPLEGKHEFKLENNGEPEQMRVKVTSKRKPDGSETYPAIYGKVDKFNVYFADVDRNGRFNDAADAYMIADFDEKRPNWLPEKPNWLDFEAVTIVDGDDVVFYFDATGRPASYDASEIVVNMTTNDILDKYLVTEEQMRAATPLERRHMLTPALAEAWGIHRLDPRGSDLERRIYKLEKKEVKRANEAGLMILREWNRRRRMSGLKPVTSDPALSLGPWRWTFYLAAGGRDTETTKAWAHDVDMSHKWATRSAYIFGRRSGGSGSEPLKDFVLCYEASHSHGKNLRYAAVDKVGIGVFRGQVGITLETAENPWGDKDFTWRWECREWDHQLPVLYPGPGAELVPRAFGEGGEDPSPVPPNAVKWPGTPIGVQFTSPRRLSRKENIEEVQTSLVELRARGDPARVVYWEGSPEYPIVDSDRYKRTRNEESILIFPTEALNPNTWYRARVNYVFVDKEGGRIPMEFEWEFRTDSR